MSQFAGKVTVATSAGSGIGRALAVALTAEGARVAPGHWMSSK
jgi:NAD(P)-dependent dehydrogenase (short-subunit alcohol dehydrogenase family)